MGLGGYKMESLVIVRTARLFTLYREVTSSPIEAKIRCSPCNSNFGLLEPNLPKFEVISL